jgi:hypothetical protein
MPSAGRSLVLSILAILAMISGCKNGVVETGTDDPFSALPADSIVGPSSPIDSKVLFSFTEYINPAIRTTSLHFRTERIYGMGGYEIVSSVTQEGNRISVRLDSIRAPGGGTAEPRPATSSFDLGALPNGLYSMNISINTKSIAALLLLSDTSFITRIQPNNLLTTSRPRLLRVPQKIVWGEAESIPPSVYQLFLDSLVILGATSATLSAGEYFYFSINSDGSFTIPSALGFPYGRHFLYRFDPDTNVSRSLVKRFAKRYQDSIYIRLTGGRGEMYYTTVLLREP